MKIIPKKEEFNPETLVADNDPPVIEIAENITVYDTLEMLGRLDLIDILN